MPPLPFTPAFAVMTDSPPSATAFAASMRTLPASLTVPFAAIVPKLPTFLPEMATLPPTKPEALTVPVMSTSSAEASEMSPSTASRSPPTETLPAAVALTDLPCRSLPEATDICLWSTTTSEPGFASVANVMSPFATTASFTRMLPSVTTSTSPEWSASPTTMPPPSPPPKLTLMSSSTSANWVMSSLTLPSPTLSMSTTLPAPTLSAPTFEKSAPDSTETDFPTRATSPPAMNSAPFATETEAADAPSTGVGMALPPRMAPFMSDSFSSPAAATEKSPPTFTDEPFMNETPAGLNIHSEPDALRLPAIWDADAPPTTL